MASEISDAPYLRAAIRRRELFWAIWAVAAAFGCYFCMYAFRKPFTVAGYSDTELWGIGFKTILVTAQVFGYMVSKFLGIRVIAEMPPRRRAMGILLLIVMAEIALILFGVVPRPWNAVCLFLNGFPLGMVFGLVLGYLEGRRLTEALTAGLCASFILADGVTKSVGAWLLHLGVSEEWMPACTGGLFLLPLGICVAMLSRVPPPSLPDIAARSERAPMTRTERWHLASRYAAGLIPLVVMYLLVTIVRSVRADFAPEIWAGLGTTPDPGMFTRSEMWIAVGVLIVNGSAILIRDNRRAFFASLITCGCGTGLLAIALLAQQVGMISGFAFMVLIGLGLYLPYVAMHTTVFERLLGMTRERGNLGFLMYVADAVGYLGYVCVMLARNFSSSPHDLLGLTIFAGWFTVGISTVCLIQCGGYFLRWSATASVTPAAEGAT